MWRMNYSGSRRESPWLTLMNYGKSLRGVQNNLQKKHQSLLNEISSREPNIEAVTVKAKELTESDHVACNVIQQQNTELQQRWREAELLASRRSQKLNEAVESQKVNL
eukprot:Em0003g1486a